MATLGAVAEVAGVVASPLVLVDGPLLLALALIERRRRRRWRSASVGAEAWPGAVDRLIQHLQAGSSLVQACRSLGATVHSAVVLDPLEGLVAALDRGVPLVDAAEALAVDEDPSARLMGTTLAVLARNGGPAEPSLRRLRHTLVGRAHRRRRSLAQASSATASAGLLALAPGLFALILAGAEPDLAAFYLRSPLGTACATGSLLLSALGWWWIQATVNRSVRGWS